MNKLWTQIMSDVTGAEQVCISNGLGSPAGDAYLAGLGVGAFKDISTIRDKWIKDTWTVRPNGDNNNCYDQYYQIFKKLYPMTKEQMHLLADLGSGNKNLDTE